MKHSLQCTSIVDPECGPCSCGATQPHSLTREQVEEYGRNLSAGQFHTTATFLLAHDAAQRLTIDQQAQEIERLRAVDHRWSRKDINELEQQLAAMTAERDAAQERYERQCAGTKSRIEEIVHLRSAYKQLQAALTASEQEVGRLREALEYYAQTAIGALAVEALEWVQRALKGA